MPVTRDQFAVIMPAAKAAGRLDTWYAPVTNEMISHGITTPTREAMFLANVAEETGELAAREENLRYSGQRLCQVFPSMFRDRPQFAEQLAGHGPEAIANYIYADANRPPGYRMGNVHPGDGWLYRGRGPMQLTGRGNYARFFRSLGMPEDSDPDLVLSPEVGARSAAHFWQEAGCNELADTGDFAAVVKRVNGGHGNMSIRLKYLERAKRALAAPLLDVTIPPPGYERKPDGNIMRKDMSQSGIVQDSNVGSIIATAGAAAGSAAPIVQAWLGADWKVAAVFALVVIALGGGALFYFASVKKRRRRMHADGLA